MSMEDLEVLRQEMLEENYEAKSYNLDMKHNFSFFLSQVPDEIKQNIKQLKVNCDKYQQDLQAVIEAIAEGD